MTNNERYKRVFDVLAASEPISLEAENMMNKKHKKPFLAATTAAAIAFGTLSVCAAAYFNWNNGLTESLQISEKQQKELEDNGMAVFSDVSCTDAGVTISALQSITDNYYTYLAFKVEGFELDKGLEPGFETVNVTVDGCKDFSWGGSFYNGILQSPDGCSIYADGSPVDADQLSEGHYTREDGGMEYHMVLSNTSEEGYFEGKSVHVEFETLGTFGDTPAIDGKWVLDWTLGGADTSRTFKMDEVLGNTGAVVKEAEISPISFRITCQFPRTEVSTEYEQEDGTVNTITEYKQAPWASGLKLKDGTLLKSLYGGTGVITDGFVDESSDMYVIGYAFDQIIDVDEVDSILFAKEVVEDLTTATEENYDLVSLK